MYIPFSGVVMLVILIRKRFLGFCCLFFGLFLSFAIVFWQGGEAYRSASGKQEIPTQIPATVVIDAGHGGQDGGASSPDGVQESGLNLEIAFRLQDLLALTGQGSVMTRTADESVHTPGAQRWKASDLQNRVAQVNAIENSILLSIHQNSLPSSTVTHGAQVFHNQIGRAERITASIQTALNESINVGNEKEIKVISSGVYLMKHITSPGILVECGFLSNPEETVRLQESAYQIKLAAAITAGYWRSAGEDGT